MKLHWIATENTPDRFTPAGTVAEVDDELGKRLIAEGIAEPVVVKAERAVKPKASTATKK